MFWKSISSHTHAFLFLIFNALRCVFKNQVIFSKRMFLQIFDWSNLFIDQSKSFLKIFVSLCLVWLIETVFQSIEHRESGFLKMDLDFFKGNFFKSFSSFLSLSLRFRLRSTSEFCRFWSFLLQGFFLQTPVRPFYPSFCFYFLISCIFMHF